MTPEAERAARRDEPGAERRADILQTVTKLKQQLDEHRKRG